MFFVPNDTTQFEYLVYMIPAACGGVLPAWVFVSLLNWFRARRVTKKCVGVERAVQLSFEPETDFVTLTFSDDRYADRFAAINSDNRTY